MPRFTVHNIIKIPLDNKHVLDKNRIKSLIAQHEVWGKSGCYIFSVPKSRNANGFIPVYVGKAAKTTFGKECFSPDKVNKLNEFLLHHPTKELFLFLIKHPKQQGQNNKNAIGEMETSLIKLAASMNEGLLNKQEIKPYNWSIRGVIRGGSGKPSKAALALRDQLGLDGC